MKPNGNTRAWFLPLLVMLYFAATVSLLPPVCSFEQGSDGLIVDSLQLAASQNDPSPFMVREDPRNPDRAGPYYSQFGLTYRLLLPFRAFLPYSHLHTLLSLFSALATGALFLWFHRVVARAYGNVAAGTFLILCCATPAFVFFSGSFYWQLPLLAAPFMLAHAWADSKPRTCTLAVFAVLFLRFLGGYEYASTLILSPIAAVFLGSVLGDIPLRRATILAVPLGVAGLAAFAAALGIHLMTLGMSAGGWSEGIARFNEVARYRTSGDYFGRKITLRSDLIDLINSFFRNEVILVCGLAAVALFLAAATRGRAASLRIACALLFAFLCSLSWQVLARGHMRDHAHINFIVYLIPFGLSVYLAFSRVVGDLVKSRFVENGSTSAHAETNRRMQRM